jgi:polysaccharide export outer membrane protein
LTESGEYTVIPVNLNAILANADMSQNFEMQPGDILYVPHANFAQSGEVFVTGEVSNRGPVPLPLRGEMGVAQLMLRVGQTEFSKISQVKLIRQAPDGSKLTIKVDAEKILETGDFKDDIPLQDGDIIIVPTKYLSI